MKKYFLLTPGPTPVPPDVASQEALPILHHRTKEFGDALLKVIEELKYVFQTKNDVLLFTSSGTGVMEAAVVNLLSPGDKVIVASCGVFGNRWEKICRAFGLDVVKIESEWGEAVSPEEVESALKKNPESKAVFTVHTETSTGVYCDLKSMGEIIKRSDSVFVVDSISGLCGQELYTDEWGLDVVVSASQKGLMCPPGLSFVSISEKAWDLVKSSRLPKFYWEFTKMKKMLGDRQTSYTPAVTIVIALLKSLEMIRQEGLENIFKRTKRLAEALREAIISMGLQMFANPQCACNVLTSIKMPEGIVSTKVVNTLRNEFGISIADGQERLKGKIIRIAHMGYIRETDLVVCLSFLARVLSSLGFSVKGEPCKKFQEVLVHD